MLIRKHRIGTAVKMDGQGKMIIIDSKSEIDSQNKSRKNIDDQNGNNNQNDIDRQSR